MQFWANSRYSGSVKSSRVRSFDGTFVALYWMAPWHGIHRQSFSV